MATTRMPVFFFGHGSPMNAIEDNAYSREWIRIGSSIPTPKSVVCISAHWETRGTGVTAMEKPRTIHDFGGFPRALFEKQYPAPGDPVLANRIREVIHACPVQLDTSWGLDHGTWSVLCRVFPRADVPVVQLSLDRTVGPEIQYQLGRELQPLRDEGVLIVGSGNIVHNLRMVVWDGEPYDWAVEFDRQVRDWIVANDHEPIIHYEQQGRAAALSINSAEHYLPLLYVLGARREDEPVTFFNEEVMGGSLSMRGLRIG